LQEPSESIELKKTHLKEKLEKLKSEMQRLEAIARQVLAAPDKQISLTDPESRSMATSGRGSGVVGYNVQIAVDTEHYLIVHHEVTNVGSDRWQLASTATAAKEVLGVDRLEAVADRGYFNGEEIKACGDAGITVTLPKPMTSCAKSASRFGKQDFVYKPREDVYLCQVGEKLTYRFTAEEHARTFAGIGPMRAVHARSRLSARQERSGAFRGGSMRPSSRTFKRGSIKIQTRCAPDARLSSIPSAR